MMIASHILEQSLLFLPLSLGIFFSYRILRCTDLTVDGSFVLGAAVFAKLASSGSGSLIAQLAALLSGALAGIFVSAIQTRIPSLLSGILVLFILNSLNLHVMGRPNISLLNVPCLPHHLTALLCIGGALLTTSFILLHSRIGLLLRAFGNNPKLIQQQGYSPYGIRTLGLVLSNGLVASCGALTAQVNGYADIQMGFGMVLIGIGTVALGQRCLQALSSSQRFSPSRELFSCLVGVLLYFSTLHCFLSLGISPLYLKMAIGFCLIALMMNGELDHV